MRTPWLLARIDGSGAARVIHAATADIGAGFLARWAEHAEKRAAERAEREEKRPA